MSKNSSSTSAWFVIKTVVATVAIFFGAQIIVGIWFATIMQLMGYDQEQITSLLDSNLLYILTLSLGIALLSVFGVWSILRIKRKDPLKYLGLDKKSFHLKEILRVLKVYVVYFLVLVVIMSLVDSATNINVDQQQELGINDPRGALEYVQIFFLLSIIPPIFEEILFRGFLYRTLRHRVPVLLAAALTSVLFGIAHLEYQNLNWVAAIDTMVFSGFLIYLVEKQQSLYGAILLHMLKNTIAFFALFVYS